MKNIIIFFPFKQINSSVPTENDCDKNPKLRNKCSYCKTFDGNPQESNLAVSSKYSITLFCLNI